MVRHSCFFLIFWGIRYERWKPSSCMVTTCIHTHGWGQFRPFYWLPAARGKAQVLGMSFPSSICHVCAVEQVCKGVDQAPGAACLLTAVLAAARSRVSAARSCFPCPGGLLEVRCVILWVNDHRIVLVGKDLWGHPVQPLTQYCQVHL